ncbi:MAG: hypothetical protein H6741_07305 [Alphaproteobacteria bacterium]|nr:hypothetical protein [Alphaproteobacteria bacterium]
MRLLPVLLLSGCVNGLLSYNTGVVAAGDVTPVPDRAPIHPEGLLSAHAAIGYNSVGMGLGARSRFGARAFELSVAPEVCVYGNFSFQSEPGLHACGGVSPLILGVRDGAFSLGLLSPYVEPSLSFPLNGSGNLFITAPVGFDWRVTRATSTWYAGLTIGVGFVGSR